jgi:hypothetical protein
MDRYLIESPHEAQECKNLLKDMLANGDLHHFKYGSPDEWLQPLAGLPSALTSANRAARCRIHGDSWYRYKYGLPVRNLLPHLRPKSLSLFHIRGILQSR